jgi:hypothetical protein
MTWANDAPLETLADHSAPMACGPNVDQTSGSSDASRSTGASGHASHGAWPTLQFRAGSRMTEVHQRVATPLYRIDSKGLSAKARSVDKREVRCRNVVGVAPAPCTRWRISSTLGSKVSRLSFGNEYWRERA